MASGISPPTVALPQQSILTLDKSDEPISVLISRACDVLEINLDEQWERIIDGGQQTQRPIKLSDPRPQWALKWLLKKLESAEIHRDNPRFKWRVWMLLRALTLRTSISNSARLFKAHGLVGILREIFQGLYDNRPMTMETDDEEASQQSENDSDTIGSSHSETRTSKKRRRDGTEIEESQSFPNIKVSAVHRTFVSVCIFLTQLQSFTTGIENTQNYAVEHMKSSLKSTPQDAAKILGNCLYLVNEILHATYRDHSCRYSKAKQLKKIACNLCLSSAVGFWNARSNDTHDFHHSPTNVSHSITVHQCRN